MSEVLVASSADLTTALKAAQPGDTVLLQPGVYSGLALRGLSFSEAVTIASADPANKAVLTNFQINSVEGLVFRNLDIEVSGAGTYGVNIYSSSNLTFDRVFVHGSLDGNPHNDPGGLGFLNTSNVTITNSTFTELRQGAGIGGGVIDNVVVADNHAFLLMKTGFVFAGVSNARITGNVIGDIRPTGGAHPDAIQFFTTGTNHSAHDILISGNLVYRGDGAATQGIFVADQTRRLPYENVTISDNVVVGTGYGGIYVTGVNGLKITGNDLISNPGDTNRTFLLVQRSSDVTSTQNRAVSFGYDDVDGLVQSGNTVTRAVDDLGKSVLNLWRDQNPEDAALLAPFVDPPAPPPAPVSFFDQDTLNPAWGWGGEIGGWSIWA